MLRPFNDERAREVELFHSGVSGAVEFDFKNIGGRFLFVKHI